MKYIPIDVFMKSEALKELVGINQVIDQKIEDGEDYSKEASEHKSLVAIATA